MEDQGTKRPKDQWPEMKLVFPGFSEAGYNQTLDTMPETRQLTFCPP